MPNEHNNTPVAGFSYFGLALLAHLRESHPHRAADSAFIAARATVAAQTYSEAICSGLTPPEASEKASEVLFQGLHFSLYATLRAVLCEEFAEEITEEELPEAVRILFPFVRDLETRYGLTDDFASTPEYDLLYTEVVGTVQILLRHGLQ